MEKTRLVWVVLVFFVIHLILQLVALLLSFSVGMAEFDNPDNEALRIKSSVYDGIYVVLTFPATPIFYHLTFDSFFEN